MRRHTHPISLIVLCSALLPLSSQAAFKCWTNNEGVRECGNAIPPEYAQQQSSTISEQGVTLEVQKRAKTPEELEAERARQEAEQARLEAEKKRQAEEQARLEEQKKKDKVLLATFTSVEDIRAARDRRLTSIDGTVDITHVTIDKLKETLANQKKRAAEQERSGKGVSEELKQDIARTEKQIADKQSYIRSKEREQEAIRQKAEEDIARFTELKGQ